MLAVTTALARVHLRGGQGKPAAAANADHRNFFTVHKRLQAEKVHTGAEVFREQVRRGDVARLALALAHVTGIKGQHHKPAPGKLVGVNAGPLFLDAAVGSAHNHRHVRPGFVQGFGCVQIAGNHQAVAVGIPDMSSLHQWVEGMNIIAHLYHPSLFVILS